MLAASALVLLPLILLLGKYGFRDSPDSGIPTMIILVLLILSGLCFGAIERNRAVPLFLALQVLILVSGLLVDRWAIRLSARRGGQYR